MICLGCKANDHDKCKDLKDSVTRTWCDCQHNPPGHLQKQTIAIPAIESEEKVWET